MIVRSKYSNCSHLGQGGFRNIGYFSSSELMLTEGKDYQVYSVAFFEGNFIVQVINDANVQDWMLICFFEVIEGSVANDWISRFFEDEPKMILGPEFVSKSIDAYNAMVEGEPRELDLFWKRVESIRKKEIFNLVLSKLRLTFLRKMTLEDVARWARDFSASMQEKKDIFIGSNTSDLVDILMGFDVKKDGEYLYDEEKIIKLLCMYEQM